MGGVFFGKNVRIQSRMKLFFGKRLMGFYVFFVKSTKKMYKTHTYRYGDLFSNIHCFYGNEEVAVLPQVRPIPDAVFARNASHGSFFWNWKEDPEDKVGRCFFFSKWKFDFSGLIF